MAEICNKLRIKSIFFNLYDVIKVVGSVKIP